MIEQSVPNNGDDPFPKLEWAGSVSAQPVVFKVAGTGI